MHTSEELTQLLRQWIDIIRRYEMGNISAYARDNGLTMAQLGVMLHVHHRGACGVSDIGSELGVTNSAASQMLERLVQLDLITRSEDAADRRVKQVDLTEKGRQILHRVRGRQHAWMDELVQAMSAPEQEQVKQALSILIDKARQLETERIASVLPGEHKRP